MNETQNVQQQIGPGFCGCLALLFIALKLTGHIAWSWWWVLSPLWIPVGAIVSFMLLLLIASALACLASVVVAAALFCWEKLDKKWR